MPRCLPELNRVSLDAFEGPLDLLLHLVKHDEVDIFDLSLERLTRQFLEVLDQAEVLDVPLAGEFIVMAAHLIHLKSRELLPKHILPPDEDPTEDDPRWDLIRQLLEYRKFKDAASHLAEAEASRALLYPLRPPPPLVRDPGDAPLEVDLGSLFAAFQQVLARAASAATASEIIDDRWTVAEKITDLRQSLPSGRAVRFRTLFRPGASRSEWIVTFLAILELMKIRELRASQSSFEDDIELQRI